MALAIAYYIRTQQDMKPKTPEVVLKDNMYKDFGIEEESDGDIGTDIEII